MSHLYELVGKWQYIAEMAFESADDGCLPPDLLAELARIDEDIDSKLENCCKVVQHIEAMSEAHRQVARRQEARARAGEASAQRLMDEMQKQMAVRGWKKRVCGIFNVGIQNSTPHVVINDMAAVPHEYDKTAEREVSKSAIKDAIDAGKVVPGACLETGTHLRIR